MVSGEIDVARQQNQVKDFIVRKVGAIVLMPVRFEGDRPAIQEANAAGHPRLHRRHRLPRPGRQGRRPHRHRQLRGRPAGGRGDDRGARRPAARSAILDYKEVESCLLRVKGFKEVHRGAQPPARSGEDRDRGRAARRRGQGQGLQGRRGHAPGPPRPRRASSPSTTPPPSAPGRPGEGGQGRPGQDRRLRRPARRQAGDQARARSTPTRSSTRTGSAARPRATIAPVLRRARTSRRRS